VFCQHAAAERFNLAKRDSLESARAFKAKVKATDAREK